MSADQRQRHSLYVALAVWLISRIAFLLAYPGGRVGTDSLEYYIPIARNLSELGMFSRDGVLPTAFVGPLYPAFLSLVQSPFGFETFWPAQIVQVVMDGLVVLMLVQMSVRISGNRSAAVAVVLLHAAYLSAARCVASIQTETLYTLLQTVSIILLVRSLEDGRRRWWVGFGTSFGLAALCRPAILAWFPLIPLIFLCRSAGGRQRILGFALVGLAAVLVIAPWTARNAVRLDALFPVASQGTYSLYRGALGDGLLSPIPVDLADEVANMSEAVRAKTYMRAAIREIRGDFSHWCYQVLAKFSRFWLHVPDPRPLTAGNRFTIPFHAGVLILAMIGSVRLPAGSRLIALIIWHYALCMALTHSLGYAVVRYSVPVITVLLVLASVPVARSLELLFASRVSKTSDHRPLADVLSSKPF